MTTRQPEWKLVANLGDVSFVEYGGMLVYKDTTGVYEAEGEEWIPSDEEGQSGECYRFSLDRCKMNGGHLIPFKYEANWPHPASDYTMWFDEHIPAMAEFSGVNSEDELRQMFCSDNPSMRAMAYEIIGSYHGWHELDDYPLTLTESEAEERYREVK